jgi:hypothetical protein
VLHLLAVEFHQSAVDNIYCDLKPKSILYGNGSLTRNIYSPHNNNLTSIEIGRGGDLIINVFLITKVLFIDLAD